MRLGELLVADGILTDEQVQTALRAQVMWGGRLGTNLVELGSVDLDALSGALGRQHVRPAALARHFERVDRELQRLLSPDFADRFSCVPLCRVGEERNVVVAVAGPLDTRGQAIIAEELAINPAQIIQAVAAELRIRYHLERVYNIPRGARFLRSRGPSIPAFPYAEAPDVQDSTPDVAIPELTEDDGLTSPIQLPVTVPVHVPVFRPSPVPVPESVPESVPDRVEPAVEPAVGRTPTPPPPPAVGRVPTGELDDLAIQPSPQPVAPPPAPEEDGRDRRRYVRTLADMVDAGVPTGLDHKTLGRIAIRRVTVNAEPRGATPDSGTFPDATRAIRRATDRDHVAELAMEAIDRFTPTCEAAMLLVVRGEVAIGWKGFVRGAAPPPELAVPFEDKSLIVLACKNVTARCSAEDLAPIDRLLLEAFGRTSGDLVVVPVVIAGQVTCMIAIATAPDAPVAAVEAVAAAAGAAFARLMRDASR